MPNKAGTKTCCAAAAAQC